MIEPILTWAFFILQNNHAKSLFLNYYSFYFFVFLWIVVKYRELNIKYKLRDDPYNRMRISGYRGGEG